MSHYLIPCQVVLLSCLHFAAADDGDDFSNDLFTDLSPLLALFGERVTTQFMSQSIGFADCIVLAMAPLGIVTIIVSAIRVGGPPLLKAIIGRARENLSTAEVDLMSSTSKEVCEVWNGQTVVRCPGTAPVWEFVCVLPKAGHGGDVKVNKLQRAPELEEIKNDSAFSIINSAWQWIVPVLGLSNPSTHRADEERPPTPMNSQTVKDERAGITILRHTELDAPCLSLNRHSQLERREVYAAAVFGIILQLCVLLYFGLISHYWSSKFQKDDHRVDAYAFSLAAGGTVILLTGILLCGHVVESSTDESYWRPVSDREAFIVWLQQKHTVNDQNFESWAIYNGENHRTIVSSRRAVRETDTGTSSGPQTSSDQKELRQSDHARTILEIKTFWGCGLSLSGFVLQFVGLRRMHWSASIAQLISVIIMTILRAAIRRGLGKAQRSTKLLPRYELDWFAMCFGDPKTAPFFNNSESTGEPTNFWLVSTGDDKSVCAPLRPSTCPPEDERTRIVNRLGRFGNQFWNDQAEIPPDSSAQIIMTLRRKLGKLADWRGPASTEAISLTIAIESFMNFLYCVDYRDTSKSPMQRRKALNDPQQFTWCIKIGDETVKIFIKFTNGSWRTSADDIEAALSLWLYSVQERNQRSSGGKDAGNGGSKQQNDDPNSDDDEWLRAKGSWPEEGLRLLGPDTLKLRRDLIQWMPSEGPDMLKVEEKKRETATEHAGKALLEVEERRIVGCGGTDAVARLSNIQEPLQKKVWLSSRCTTDQEDGEEQQIYGPALAVVSLHSLEKLYALDLFSNFVWAAASKSIWPANVEAGSRYTSPSSLTELKHLRVRNDSFSKLTQKICDTGLGSMIDIYLSLIPPFSFKDKLPGFDLAYTATELAHKHEASQRWEEAGEVYFWLLEVSSPSQLMSGVAASVGFLRALAFQIGLKSLDEEHGYDKWTASNLCQMKARMEKTLEKVDKQTPFWFQLRRLFQNRLPGEDVNYLNIVGHEPEHEGEGKEDIAFFEAFNLTELHIKVMKANPDVELIDNLELLKAKDIFGCIPIHYTAAKGTELALARLLRRGSPVNSVDARGLTPLHYACSTGHISTVNTLLKWRAEINPRGVDGSTPLHYAASCGHVEIVELLRHVGAVLDVVDARGWTPLHYAAYLGHRSVVEVLRDSPVRNTEDAYERSPLHLAVMANHKSVFESFKNDVGAKDREGRTPLVLAALHVPSDLIRPLLAIGANPDAADHEGSTPLHMACKRGNNDSVQLLLNANADINARDRDGYTPLHLAAIGKGDMQTAQLLTDKGCLVSAGGKRERTALHCAVAKGKLDFAEVLLKNAPDCIYVRDSLSRLPIHYAAQKSRLDFLKRFLKPPGSESDINITDDHGRTLLHFAAYLSWGGDEGDMEVVKWLVDRGLRADQKDENGHTPLSRAGAYGTSAISEYLGSLGGRAASSKTKY
ncbi:hypothetical protein FDECE_5320 [Fusarium decemcellulare]|nr:hypothetical protein FDECE_5320 [Fusarium decemcellulare]